MSHREDLYCPHDGSQFEKYKELVHCVDPEEWVMFTDDDDLWHPDRVKAFLDAAQGGSNVVRIKNLAMNFGAEKQTYKTATEVSEAIEQLSVDNRVDRSSHVQYMVKAKVLKDFLEAANVAHKYCDSALCHFLNARHDVLTKETDCWMYFFRSHPGQVCKQPRHSVLVDKMTTELQVTVNLFESVTKLSNAREALLTPLHYMFDRLELCISNEGFAEVDQQGCLDEAFKMFYKVRDTDAPTSSHRGMSSIIRMCLWPFVEDCLRRHQAFLQSLDVA